MVGSLMRIFLELVIAFARGSFDTSIGTIEGVEEFLKAPRGTSSPCVLGDREILVAMIFLMTIGLGLAALALRHAETAEALLLLVQACLIVAMITILEWSGRRKQ